MHFLHKLNFWRTQRRAEALKQEGFRLLYRGDNERAEAVGNHALQLNPDLIEARNLRGRARYRLGDYAGAIADFTEVLCIERKRADVHLNRGLAYFCINEVHDALGDINLAIFYDPHQALAYSDRAAVEELTGNLRAAIADYTQAIRLNPRMATTYTQRGSARAEGGDVPGAIADYQRYLALGGGERHGDQSHIEGLISTLKRQLEE